MSEEKDFFKTCFNTVAGLPEDLVDKLLLRSINRGE